MRTIKYMICQVTKIVVGNFKECGRLVIVSIPSFEGHLFDTKEEAIEAMREKEKVYSRIEVYV